MKGSVKIIAVDTGVFVSWLDNTDKHHQACMDCLNNLAERTRFYTTEACLTETTHLLPSQQTVRQQLRALIKLLDIEVIPLSPGALDRVWELMDKYGDLPMDFADATLVTLCEKHDIHHVLTLDRRGFTVFRPRHLQHFKLLPENI